jgi:sec-independent protein translocase protein TatA
MPDIGWQELLIVLIVALVIFGPKRLPDLGHSLGKGIREFRKGVSGAEEQPDPEAEQPRQVTPATVSAPGSSPQATGGAASGGANEPQQTHTRASA